MTSGNTVRLDFHSSLDHARFRAGGERPHRRARPGSMTIPFTGSALRFASRSSTRSSMATATTCTSTCTSNSRRSGRRPARASPIRVRDEGCGFDPYDAGRSAGAGKPSEDQRPRHLPHAELHGRNHAPARGAGRHGSPNGQAGSPIHRCLTRSISRQPSRSCSRRRSPAEPARSRASASTRRAASTS